MLGYDTFTSIDFCIKEEDERADANARHQYLRNHNIGKEKISRSSMSCNDSEDAQKRNVNNTKFSTIWCLKNLLCCSKKESEKKNLVRPKIREFLPNQINDYDSDFSSESLSSSKRKYCGLSRRCGDPPLRILEANAKYNNAKVKNCIEVINRHRKKKHSMFNGINQHNYEADVELQQAYNSVITKSKRAMSLVQTNRVGMFLQKIKQKSYPRTDRNSIQNTFFNDEELEIVKED